MSEKTCPLMGVPCIEQKCKWFIMLLGDNPQTGKPLKQEWDCTIPFIPILLIENSKLQRETGAAVESFRNQTVKRADLGNRLIAGLIRLVQTRRPVKNIETIGGSNVHSLEERGG